MRVYQPDVLRPNLLGVVAGLGTAVAFAFYILASRSALKTMGAWTLLAYAYLFAGLAWSAVLPPWEVLGKGFPAEMWGAFLAVATLGTVVLFGLFISGLRYLPPTHLASWRCSSPSSRRRRRTFSWKRPFFRSRYSAEAWSSRA